MNPDSTLAPEPPAAVPIGQPLNDTPQPTRPAFPTSILVLVTLLVLITATLITFLLPEYYQSTARIRIGTDRPDIAPLQGQPTASGYDPYFIQTELEVLYSELVLGKVVRELDLAKLWTERFKSEVPLRSYEAMDILNKRTSIHPVRNTSIVEISVTDENPAEAARLANAIANAYSEHRHEQRRKLRLDGIQVLEQAYAKNLTQLQTAQATLADLARKLNDPNAAPLIDAKKQIEDLSRFGQALSMKIAAERVDLMLPAMGMVQLIDTAIAAKVPIKPNRTLNIFVGMVVGFLAGLFLATVLYLLNLREYRRRSGFPRNPLPPRFRATIHILIALLAGIIVGYHCASPSSIATIIVIPITLILAAAASTWIELANLTPLPANKT